VPLFKRRSSRKTLRLYVASDVHGSTRCFRKLLNAAKHYDANALVLAGDLTGKLVVPIEHLGNGTHRSRFLGIEHLLNGDEELAAHEKVIEDAGSYAHRVEPDELVQLSGDEAAVDRIFHDLVLARMKAWLDLAEERLEPAGVPLFAIPGNDDFPEIDALFEGRSSVRYIDGRVERLADGREIAGLGVSNITPWHAPRDLAEDEIARRLDSLELEDPERAVLAIHVPPKGTSIDVAVELDEDLRPTGSGTTKVHVGSSAVRDYVERVQPLLTLHGHIHESQGVDHVGRTPCMNPGSEYGEGILRGIVVNLAEDGVTGHLFVSG
jgi:Icc-related predicted phosphoesterase